MRPSSVSIPPLEEQPQMSSPSLNLTIWAGDNETDRSYDSSQLQPSPSILSVSTEEPNATSFRRPSGSSLNKLSTLSISSSILTTRTSLHRLEPSPVLRPSESPASPASSLSSSITSSSGTSSSFSDEMSSPSLPSLSPSSIVLLPLPEEPGIQDEESVVGISPRTISTLLDTACASLRSASRSPSPIPIQPRIYIETPERTSVTSVSMPYVSGGTEQASSLKSVSEKPLPPTPRDFALELDGLAEDLRGYNDAREQESREIVDSVKALRDELQGLSAYSRSRARPPDVVTIIERPVAPDPRQMNSRSVGGSTEITTLHHRSSPEEEPESIGAALRRASSVTSSVESFLSSHHSDDLSLYGYRSASPVSPISDMESESEDESSFVSSSEVTESEASVKVVPEKPVQTIPPTPIPPPEIIPVPPVQIMPIPPPEILPTSSTRRSSSSRAPLVSVDWMAPITGIMDQVDNLAKTQAATVRKMDSLRAPEYPEIPGIHHKIDRVEDLVRGLLHKFESWPSQPVVVPQAVPIHQPTIVPPEPRPPSQAATIHDQLPYS